MAVIVRAVFGIPVTAAIGRVRRRRGRIHPHAVYRHVAPHPGTVVIPAAVAGAVVAAAALLRKPAAAVPPATILVLLALRDVLLREVLLREVLSKTLDDDLRRL